ncbi:MAG TPA: LPS assembly protein LptD [Patescibacteria group bacterium]|nr:LPS assembly protein LptD [Patescibacteria group bacterium]
MSSNRQYSIALFSILLATIALPAVAQISSADREMSAPTADDAPWRKAILPRPFELADEPAATTQVERYSEAQDIRQRRPPSPPSAKKGQSKNPDKEPLDLTADQLEHDEQGQTITATGHVEIVQAGRILRAEKVVYFLKTDTVSARGNVVISEPNGNVHFADEVQLTQKMGKGFVKGLESYLSSGGRFTAKSGEQDGKTKTMHEATYTPCECEEDGKHKPAWQIKARQIVYHEDTHRISAKGAQLDFFGVPGMWTPYISIPDGKEKRKSGLLTPQFNFHSNLGIILTENYYWAIAPDRDLTMGAKLATNKEPVALADYRQRFDQAQIDLRGSLTHADWTDSIGSQDVDKGNRWRGHFFSDGLWDIDDKWRAGEAVRLTTDDEYLREYDFDHSGVLDNQIYLERFSGRNYASGKLFAFQDVRVDQDRTDQPDVLPQININLLGDPNGTFGGRWNFDASMLGLHRNGSGQDMNRFSSDVGWQRRYVTGFGLVNTFDAGGRGDLYYISNRDPTTVPAGTNSAGEAARFYPHAQLTTAYPFARPFEKMQAMVEPIAAISASTTGNLNKSVIPNEDSQDVELDANNIFDYNRFPGLDRVEDGAHVTYGVRTGLYGYNGAYGNIFLGESTRLSTHNNPFPTGSGLSHNNSDVVGQIAAGADNSYGLNYRFLLDSVTLAPQRHEVSGFADWDRFRFNSRFVFTKALEGTDIVTSREQMENNISYDVTHEWRIRGGAINDFGEDPGLRRAVAGIDYFGCCMSFNLTAERNIATDASGDNGTSVMFRIGLKGLGGYDTPERENEKDDGLWRQYVRTK